MNFDWIWTDFDYCLNIVWTEFEFTIQTLFGPTLTWNTEVLLTKWYFVGEGKWWYVCVMYLEVQTNFKKS